MKEVKLISSVIGFLLKNWILTLGIILGIPTSYYGYIWLNYKVLDQQVNCLNIAYSIDASNLETIEDQVNKFQDCIREVDPRISTKKFIENKI